MIFQNGKTERHGAVMAGIMAAVREVVQDALQQLCNGGGEDGSQQQDDAVASLHAALSELMQINAGAFRCILPSRFYVCICIIRLCIGPFCSHPLKTDFSLKRPL